MNWAQIFSARLLTVSALFFLLFFLFAAPERANAAIRTWDGGGTTNNWSECANWLADTCPTSTDTASFDATSTKDSNVDASFAGTVSAVQILSGYSGTLTMSRNLTASNFTQNAGTFSLGSTTFSVSSGFTITAGTFNAGTGRTAFTSSGTTDVPTTQTFYDLDINGLNGFNRSLSNDTLVVTHRVRFMDGAMSNGTIDIQGATVQASSTFDGSSGIVNFGQSGDENIICDTNGALPSIQVAKPSGTLTFSCSNLEASNFTLSSGTFSLGSNALSVATNFTISGGTFNAGTGRTAFTSSGTTDVPTTQTFYDLDINGLNGFNRSLSNDTLVVTHRVRFMDGAMSNGTIDIQGATVQASSTFDGSSGIVNFGQSGNETILCDTNGKLPALTVNKPSGTLNFSCSNLNLGGPFILQSGTFSVDSNSLTVGSSFTITGGTFDGSTGTVVFAGPNTIIDVLNSLTLYNVDFNNTLTGFGVTFGSGDTIVVANTLRFINGVVSGAITAQGNVVVTSTYDGGSSALLQFNGTGTQTFDLTGATGLFNGPITVDKTGGEVDLLSALVMDAASQNLTLTQGTFNLNGNNLTVSGTGATFTAAGLATLKLQGGETLTSPTLVSTSTVEYNGSGTYTSLNAGSTYGKLLFSGSGSWATSSALTLNGNFTQTGGTFTHSGTTTVSSDATITTSPSTSFKNFATTAGSEVGTPTGYWKFDETSAGSSAADSSTGNHAGTPTGSGGTNNLPQPSTNLAPVAYTNVRSLDFDGTDDYVNTNTALSSFISSGASTISLWLRPTGSAPAVTNSYKGQGAISDSSTYQGIYRASISGTDRIWVYNWDGNEDKVGIPYTVGDWVNIVLVHSGGTLYAYKNGTLVDSVASGNTSSLLGTLYIGRSYTSGLFWAGQIDDVRVYNTALTSTQIQNLYSPPAFTATLAGSGLNLSGNLEIGTTTTLDVSSAGCSSASCPITLAGNWSNAGIFIPRTGTVTFNGTDQEISSSNTFYNLIKTVSTAATLMFTAGTTQTITNTWTAQGVLGNLLSLRSGTNSSQWFIDPQGTRSLSYIDVKDSNNSNATAINTNGANVTNSGNNTNWTFNSAPSTPTSLAPTAFVNGSWGKNATPAFTFTTADTDSDPVAYQIIVDDSSDFASPVVSYTSAYAAPGASTFTVGQAAGSGSYTTGSSGQTLSDGSYYWEVRAGDGFATSSYAVANSGTIAFKIDTTAPTPGSVALSATTTTSLTATVSGASDSGSGLATAPYFFWESSLASTTGTTAATSWVLRGLIPNTQYSISVGVTDVATNTASTSAVSGYTLAEAPSSAAASADSDTAISVLWGAGNNPAGTEYRIINTTTGVSSGWITTTSYTATGLTQNTLYSFGIIARNGDLITTATTTASATTDQTPTVTVPQNNNQSNGAPLGFIGTVVSNIPLLNVLSDTDSRASLIIGPEKATKGRVVELSIITYNSLGRPVYIKGDKILVTVDGANSAFPTLADNGNGSYTARYLAEHTGSDIVTATVNGHALGSDTDGVSDGQLHIDIVGGVVAVATKPPVTAPSKTSTSSSHPATPVASLPSIPSLSAPHTNPYSPDQPQGPVTPEPFTIRSGVTASCYRAFVWNRDLSATIYRKIGGGHDARIAVTNAQAPWFIDIDPIEGEQTVYRFVFDDQTSKTITMSSDDNGNCTTTVRPGDVVEADIDHDGNLEQLINGVYQDTDGSSLPIVAAKDGLFIDTDGDHLPDTYWRPMVGASPVIAASDRLYIANSKVTPVTTYKPYKNGAYAVLMNTLVGGSVALAAETPTLGTYEASHEAAHPLNIITAIPNSVISIVKAIGGGIWGAISSLWR